MESIIAACITGLFAVIGIVITNLPSNKSIETKLVAGRELTDEKIDQLRKSVDRQTAVVEKVPILEDRVNRIEHRVETAELRINNIHSLKMTDSLKRTAVEN